MSKELLNAIIDAIVTSTDTPNYHRTIEALKVVVEIWESENNGE